jgi:hypothetical protein
MGMGGGDDAQWWVDVATSLDISTKSTTYNNPNENLLLEISYPISFSSSSSSDLTAN